MGVPVAIIQSEGTPMPEAFELLEINIHHEINKIPEASLLLIDGSIAKQQFSVSNAAFFKPGKKISIALRHEGQSNKNMDLFEGLVIRHAVESKAGATGLRVELKDAAFKLTGQRRSAVYRDKRDSDIIRELTQTTGLAAGEIEATGVRHRELVQYQSSDWDFLVTRADVLGMAIQVNQGKISLKPLKLAAQAKCTITYGIDSLGEFDLEIDAAQQWARYAGVGWNVKTQQLSATEQASAPLFRVGDLDVAAIAQQIGHESQTEVLPVTLETGELKAWSEASLLRSRLSFLRGRIEIDGGTDIAPLDTVELQGIGDHFNGKLLVTAVTHKVDQNGWRAELKIGMAPEWFARKPDIQDVAAGGMLPPVSHLQIGKVAPFEEDRSGEQRIKVTLPALESGASAAATSPGATQDKSIWARMVHPEAGPLRGMAFWPEPDDEVIIGFLNGDPRQAVILGALYGSTQKPPMFTGGPSQANGKRALVSKKGAVIGFDDEKVQITIQTPGGQKIVLDDEQQQISITDQHHNQILLSANGIEIKSAKDLTLGAPGQVIIKGSSIDIN